MSTTPNSADRESTTPRDDGSGNRASASSASASSTSRDNKAWLDDLRATGSRQQQALNDLSRLLFRGLAASFRGDRRIDDAFLEDAAQDALLRILERLESFRGDSQFSTWALSIAVRTALSELRRRRWRDVSLDDVTSDGALDVERSVDGSTDAARRTEQHAILQALSKLIATALSDRQRDAIVGELRGMPSAEIARRTGSNRNAIYKLTHDARKRLRQGLENQGFAADAIRSAFGD